jgi:V8-like Glu-specific endopeptidase
MTRSVRLFLVVGLTLMVVGSLLPAAAKSPSRAARFVYFDLDPMTRADVRYWTDARIDALPSPDPAEVASAGVVTAGADDGARTISGEGVSPSVRAPVRLPRITRFQSLEDFETHEITNPSQLPYSTHGKIVALTSPTNGWVCSGTIVSSESESLVLTAAHCVVSEDGARPTRIIFIPGYRNGGLASGPFGVWEASQASFPQGYLSPSGGEPNYEYDVAAFRVAALNGMTIQDRVGARGYLFNAPGTQLFQAFGYPADAPFDGEKLWTCKSHSGQRLDIAGGPDMVSMGCDMTQGSSGGGWIVNDDQINSVVSIGISTLPDVLWGPYFGSTAQTLWSTVGGGGSGPGPDPTDPVTHQMRITLKLSGALVASGRVTAEDGYVACTVNAPVGVAKKTKTGWKLVEEQRTTAEGKYRMRIPDRRGRYAAVAPEGSVDELNMCSSAESTIRRH